MPELCSLRQGGGVTLPPWPLLHRHARGPQLRGREAGPPPGPPRNPTLCGCEGITCGPGVGIAVCRGVFRVCSFSAQHAQFS